MPRPRALTRTASSVLIAGFTAAIAAITLTPAGDWPYETDQVFCAVCAEPTLFEPLGNILLFVPWAIFLALRLGGVARTLVAGAGFSLAIETAQFIIPGRQPSLRDLLLNAAGAAIGALLVRNRRGAAAATSIVRHTGTLLAPPQLLANGLAVAAAVGVGAIWMATAFLLAASLPEAAYYSSASGIDATDNSLSMGGNSYVNDNFDGTLDEIRLYDRARSEGEIATDMTMASPPQTTDLIAAYGFNEASGSEARDDSRFHNTAVITGARRTVNGRFGGALRFNFRDDVVMAAHQAQLDLTSRLTLEGWVNPASPQRAWGAIVQKQVDSYALTASAIHGRLRPAGVAVFGGVIETLEAPLRIPLNQWTYLAFTYDGAVARLYVNGREVVHRQRWIRGQVLETTLDGQPIEPGRQPNSKEIRRQLLGGPSVHVRAALDGLPEGIVPLMHLREKDGQNVCVVALNGRELVMTVRRRGRALAFYEPAISLGSVNASGGAIDLHAWRAGRQYCVTLNGATDCGPGYTLGSGWALLIYSPAFANRTALAISAVWMAALCFVPSFWIRSRLGLTVSTAIAGAALASAFAINSELSIAALEVLSGAGGALLGAACGRLTSSSRASASHFENEEDRS